MADYAQRHYGLASATLSPRVIVVHFTESDTWQSAFATFSTNVANRGELPGTCAHYVLDQAGIALRYKYYAYRWDYSYADQMHHKFFVVDGERIATGSYNLSDNAEHNTLENMVFLDDAAAPGIAARYEAEFERLWSLGQQADLYRKYMDDVDNGSGPLPIVFEPMALEWAQIADLKRAVVTACPDVNSEPFRTEPEKHQSCSR